MPTKEKNTNNKIKKPNKNMIINGKYVLGQKFGNGSFGEVYYVYEKSTELTYAAKLEDVKAKFPQVLEEAKVLKLLQNGDGYPKLIWSGTQDGFNIMICELLSQNLEELFLTFNKKFSLKTVVNLADQIISRIEYLHNLNYIHRDIKPENFMIGTDLNAKKIYMIDFGLSKLFRDPKTCQHILYKENKTLTGTARYASVNAHLGIEQSRRDDLESIGYMLIYFLKGKLPWQNIHGKNRQHKYHLIMEQKMALSPDMLCKELPPEFVEYIKYCKTLSFSDRPDYYYLKQLMKNVEFKYQLHRDKYDFDWTINGKLLRYQDKSSSMRRTMSANISSPFLNDKNSKTKGNLRLKQLDTLSSTTFKEMIYTLPIPFKNISGKNYDVMKGHSLRPKFSFISTITNMPSKVLDKSNGILNLGILVHSTGRNSNSKTNDKIDPKAINQNSIRNKMHIPTNSFNNQHSSLLSNQSDLGKVQATNNILHNQLGDNNTKLMDGSDPKSKLLNESYQQIQMLNHSGIMDQVNHLTTGKNELLSKGTIKNNNPKKFSEADDPFKSSVMNGSNSDDVQPSNWKGQLFAMKSLPLRLNNMPGIQEDDDKLVAYESSILNNMETKIGYVPGNSRFLIDMQNQLKDSTLRDNISSHSSILENILIEEYTMPIPVQNQLDYHFMVKENYEKDFPQYNNYKTKIKSNIYYNLSDLSSLKSEIKSNRKTQATLINKQKKQNSSKKNMGCFVF